MVGEVIVEFEAPLFISWDSLDDQNASDDELSWMSTMSARAAKQAALICSLCSKSSVLVWLSAVDMMWWSMSGIMAGSVQTCKLIIESTSTHTVHISYRNILKISLQASLKQLSEVSTISQNLIYLVIWASFSKHEKFCTSLKNTIPTKVYSKCDNWIRPLQWYECARSLKNSSNGRLD